MKKWIFAAALLPQLCLANASDAMTFYLDQQYQKAFTLFEQTAELGDGRSQFNLAVQYLRGQGVKADPIKAYGYFSVAIDNDFKMAEQARKSVARRLDKSQLVKAKTLAADLIARYGKSGSQSINYELSRTLNYNPTPDKTVNPATAYPDALQDDGVPGLASYLFDIDKNGVPRDLVLLNSYPAPEFGQSIAEKLSQTRFVAADRKFNNGIIRGVFAGAQDSEVSKKLEARAQQLLQQAKRDDVNAQAELATLLKLLNGQPQYHAIDGGVQAIPVVAPQISFSSITQPEFTKQAKLGTNNFNFSYLVNLNAEGKVAQWQPFEQVKIPKVLRKNAEKLMKQWQLSAADGELKDENWYHVHFSYNNQDINPEYLNDQVLAYVDIKPLINQEKEKQWRYWQQKAAMGGHSDTLFQLGVNCNLRLLTLAAKQEHTRAQLQLGKCLLAKADGATVHAEQAKYWLEKAALQGNLIAKRKLAGWYVRYSDNGSELEKAIELAEEVADENDHPLAYAYLAAAHAKLGNFEEAVDYQQQALSEANEQAFDQAPFQQSLAAYQQGNILF
ncbi:SEL1-like repeat protein [Pseudoalteromonas sp. BDTF-M6]|uniref:SEL1-like repeat protein n=1 Tax=Pseudoalteromonas sp. BDTF-M6 TaxID=2796132 RepID=UPI001BAF4FDE|nr:SEL1-like repeat protein [Pseudoalteromonas sp. BDTF-M6]MBS3799184.1 sel1 repeat family protein [Pseudoalteromonas sp. BDTF-M6]